jgi:hypothetical protein
MESSSIADLTYVSSERDSIPPRFVNSGPPASLGAFDCQQHELTKANVITALRTALEILDEDAGKTKKEKLTKNNDNAHKQ